jgi:hypothetical protein
MISAGGGIGGSECMGTQIIERESFCTWRRASKTRVLTD